MIAYGAGSGFEGGINAINGGISVDTSKYMNNILEVNIEDFDCKVYRKLHKLLQDKLNNICKR